jgi:hypothetical protein
MMTTISFEVDIDLFVTALRDFTLLRATQYRSAQLDNLFVTPLRRSTLLASPRRHATQRFVCYIAAWRNALQRNAMRRNSAPLNLTQRTETLTRKTNVQTFETNFGNV